MYKIYAMLLVVCFLSSCSMFGHKIQITKQDDESIVVNDDSGNKINTGSSNTGSTASQDAVDSFGKTSEEVKDSFYSDDSKKQKEVNDWLEDESNFKTTESGDMIEFLDYCETLIQIKDTEGLVDFITKDGDRDDFNQIIDSKSFGEYKKTYSEQIDDGFLYKEYNYSMIYDYIIDNKYDKEESLALYSVASILAYLNNDIDYEDLKASLEKDEKNYNILYVDYLEDFNLSTSCKNFFLEYGHLKGKESDD